MISLTQQQNVEECNAPPLVSSNIITPPPCFKYMLLYFAGNSLLYVSSKNLATCSCVRSLGEWGAAIEKDDKEVGDLAKMALLTSLTTPPQLPLLPERFHLTQLCCREHMLDIETTHKLASFLEAKFSLKNTREIPRPVHGPLQFQQVASARHPTKANTAKAFEKLRVATLYGRLPTSPGSLAHNRLSHSSGTVRNLSLTLPNTSENFKRCTSRSQTLAPFSHTSQTNWP